MSKVWGILIVILVFAFFANMGVEATLSLVGNAVEGIVRGVGAFLSAITNSGEGEAVG